MTDIVTAAGPSAHVRAAVKHGSTHHSIVWADGLAAARLEDRTTVALVGSTSSGDYVGVVHGFPDAVAGIGYTVAAVIVAGFACIAIERGTGNNWAPGSKVYCERGTQGVSDKASAGTVLVGYVIPGPPRIALGEVDHLDIVVAR